MITGRWRKELIALTRNQKVCENAVSFHGNNPFCPRTVYNLCRGDLNYYRFAISSERRGGGAEKVFERCLCNSRGRENCKNPVWTGNEVAETVSRLTEEEEKERRIIKEEGRKTRGWKASPVDLRQRLDAPNARFIQLKNETCLRT